MITIYRQNAIQTLQHGGTCNIEKCAYFATQRGTLKLGKGGHKLIFWRKVIAVLKSLKLHNKDLFDHKLGVMDSFSDATSEASSEEQVHTSKVPGEETRTSGREGPRNSAGVLTFVCTTMVTVYNLTLLNSHHS